MGDNHRSIFVKDARIRVIRPNPRFMSCLRILPFLLLPLLITACYEDNIACLDPSATNYDILADEACPDCCSYPSFSIDVAPVWADSAFSLNDTLPDGAGNDFRLIRFRVYLTDLVLVAGAEVLPTPENLITVGVIAGTDTVETELNANLALIQSGTTGSTIGTLRVGEEALTQVQGRLGMSSDFPAVYPPSAPASSPLSTQVNLLNFNDDTGYLTASAEYILTATNDTVRVDVRGDRLLDLDFGAPVAPVRGANLTVEIEANYQEVFGNTNLAAGDAAVAADILAGLEDWLLVVGVR